MTELDIDAERARLDQRCRFETPTRFLEGTKRDPEQPEHQRLIAAYRLLAATMNSFGYVYLRVPDDDMRMAVDSCAPAIRERLRDLITAIGGDRETGFRALLDQLEDPHVRAAHPLRRA